MSKSTKHFKSFSTLIITIVNQGESGNIVEIDETNKILYRYLWSGDKETMFDHQNFPLDIWTLDECDNQEDWYNRNSGVYCDYRQIREKIKLDPSAKAIRDLFTYYYNYCIVLVTDGQVSYSNKSCHLEPTVIGQAVSCEETPLYDEEIKEL